MRTREVTWAELLEHPEVTQTLTLRSRVGFLAIHAGLEAGTGEIALAAAEAAGASVWVCEQPPGLRWHATSRALDPAGVPTLATLLGHVASAVSLHGYGRLGAADPVLVGGSDRVLAARVAETLRRRLPGVGVVDELSAIPPALRGVHPANPVNRPTGGGVQVELPVAVRAEMTEEVAAALAAATSVVGSPVRQPGPWSA